MPNLHKAKSYISYWLNAVDEHSLQGPFIYDLFQKVFKNKDEHAVFESIDTVRQRLEKSAHTVAVTDFGAGSTVDNQTERKVADIAKFGVTGKKYGELLYRLVSYTESGQVLELGTSLGISTLYLSAEAATQVLTIEGAESLVNIAESVFEAQERKNITTICGNIDQVLPDVLIKTKPLDFVFFDANHTREATLSYFNQCLKKAHDGSCFVFDDIHWSKSMEEAWKEIKAHYRVTLSIDVFQMGIVFFNPEIRKQHFVLAY